jgi:predicted heme/steroid binding protein
MMQVTTFLRISLAIVTVCLLVSSSHAVRVVGQKELEAHGKDADVLWVAIMGEVYDVTSGRQFYGDGAPYSIFAGRDGSASFVTGDFTVDGAQKSLLDLEPIQLLQLSDWKDFYDKSKDYRHVGLLEGDLYNSEGKPTEVMNKVKQMIAEGLVTRAERAAETQAKIDERKQNDAAKAGTISDKEL